MAARFNLMSDKHRQTHIVNTYYAPFRLKTNVKEAKQQSEIHAANTEGGDVMFEQQILSVNLPWMALIPLHVA